MALARRKKEENELLLALACGGTVEAAAKKAGVGERTVYTRLKDPEFQKRLRELRDEMAKRAAGMLTAAAMEAVKTLLDVQKPNVQAAVRLGAARATRSRR
jgi:transposase